MMHNHNSSMHVSRLSGAHLCHIVMKIDPQMFVAANIKDIIFSINNIFYYCEIWLSDINVLM